MLQDHLGCPPHDSKLSPAEDGAEVAPFGSVVNGRIPRSHWNVFSWFMWCSFVWVIFLSFKGFWTPTSDVDVCEPWMHLFKKPSLAVEFLDVEKWDELWESRCGYQDQPHHFWERLQCDGNRHLWNFCWHVFMWHILTYENWNLANQLNQVQRYDWQELLQEVLRYRLIFGLVKVLNQELKPDPSTRLYIELHRSSVRFPLSWLRLNVTQFSELDRESECQV